MQNTSSAPIKILFVLGTRPEAIKLSQLINLGKKDPRFQVTVFSTGQHREMIKPVFDFFQIRPDLDFDLMKKSQKLHEVTQDVMKHLDQALEGKPPDWIIVQGDTTTVFAASLYAFYNKIRIAHVEAGLRTYNIKSPFPEEFNRRAAGLIADLHFAPTEQSANNLLREGIKESQIHITGNTGIDALFAVADGLEKNEAIKRSLQDRFQFLNTNKKLLLLTTHRRESFGEPMKNIFTAMNKLVQSENVEVLIPLHFNPTVRELAQKYLQPSPQVHIIDPLDYFSFVYVMKKSYLIMTDSGGIQEEAPSLGKPVLVLRENTERPEAVEAGTSRLVGVQEKNILAEVKRLLHEPHEYVRMSQAKNPFGDGHSCHRILNLLAEN